MKPSFKAGDTGTVGRISWRVEAGTKSPDDIVIMIRTDGWVKPKMALSFLLADFHAQSEDVLKRQNYLAADSLGGRYFMNMIRCAVDVGWRWAADKLEQQRTRRHAA